MRRPWRHAGAAGATLAVAVAWLGVAPARAQVGERIRSFDVQVVVQADGTLRVTERIRYDFGSNERHGIFRDIPVRFDYEPDNRYERLTPVEDVTVAASGSTPDDLETEQSGRLKRLRIGDPDRTITGTHEYTIAYSVRGALNAFEDHDELFWNATGNEWQVPIDQVSVRVETPGTVAQVACYAGPTSSRLPCDTADGSDGRGATFSHADLDDGEGVSVVVAVPKGVVRVQPPVLDERWSLARAFAVTPLSVALSGGLLALVVLGLVRLYGRGRDRRWAGSPVDAAFGNVGGEEEAVPLFDRSHDPVEFAPPDNVRPGQVGTLVDEVANPLDVTATIIDLAVRGYLRIEEIPKKGWFGKPDWRLVRLEEDGDLLTFERTLHRGLFQDGPEVQLSDLKRKFAERMRDVRDALYADAVAAGWFAGRPDKVRTKWFVLAVVAAVLAVAAAVVLAATTHLGLVGVPLLVAAIGLLLGAKRMPRRTPKGWAALRRVNGFRRFIEESEKERARFAERANLFSEYLPYAVVFGSTEKWARAFSGLDAEVAGATAGWYVSSHPFTVGDFGDSMDSFAVTTSGTLVATAASSGSSGFSGGGSGGGFGGGGGGSW